MKRNELIEKAIELNIPKKTINKHKTNSDLLYLIGCWSFINEGLNLDIYREG